MSDESSTYEGMIPPVSERTARREKPKKAKKKKRREPEPRIAYCYACGFQYDDYLSYCPDCGCPND
jgi:hypothetical protein